MSQVFYRKYRPSSFKELVGQDHIKNILIESIRKDRISHAYLFCGPRGTGKTTVARLMAKAINCVNIFDLGDVCNECEYCNAINAGSALDVVEMDAASNRGIDEIRNLKDSINFLPNFTKYKVFIIDEAHMLTKDAFNALLKTLEEPPEHVKFILATTEPHKIPVTILSRVQRYDFRLASKAELVSKLSKIFEEEGTKFSEDVFDTLYKYSGGSFRDAESILSKVLGSVSEEITVDVIYRVLGIQADDSINDFINALYNSNKKEALEILDNFISNSADLSVVIDQSLDKLRDLIIENIDTQKNLRYLSIINDLIDVKRKMKIINDKILVFQVGVVKICSLVPQNQKKVSKDIKSEKSWGQSINYKTANLNKVNISQKNSEIIQEEVKELDEEIYEVEPFLIQLEKEEEGDINVTGFYDFIVDKCKIEKPRLTMILGNCDFSLEQRVLIIHCDSKFNCEYIEKNIRDLNKLAFEFNNKIDKVICRFISNKDSEPSSAKTLVQSDNSTVVEDLL